ncbi:MAG TPA: NUDIX hydrolase [Verrucomicrobiae bacterium]|nr:NUDIX hydrolase [Verrucomicrobiae bacterium]
MSEAKGPIRTEVAYRTPWFDLLAKTMDAGDEPYYSLRLPDYAAILALTADRRVICVRQYRPALEGYTLELPSGIVDPGETPAESARRELMEETAYDSGELEVLGPMYPDTGRLCNQIWACVATGLRRVEGRQPEEGIEVVEMGVEELLRQTREGIFNHALHVAVILMAQLRGLL